MLSHLHSREGREPIRLKIIIRQPTVSGPIGASGRPIAPPTVADDKIATTRHSLIVLIAYHAQCVGTFQPDNRVNASLRPHGQADSPSTANHDGTPIAERGHGKSNKVASGQMSFQMVDVSRPQEHIPLDAICLCLLWGICWWGPLIFIGGYRFWVVWPCNLRADAVFLQSHHPVQ